MKDKWIVSETVARRDTKPETDSNTSVFWEMLLKDYQNQHKY